MPDQAPAANFQNSAEELVKRNAACLETRAARNAWYQILFQKKVDTIKRFSKIKFNF